MLIIENDFFAYATFNSFQITVFGNWKLQILLQICKKIDSLIKKEKPQRHKGTEFYKIYFISVNSVPLW
jgi:hypothetical protein